eukprot:7281349-Lingulodinium_polyedra.AAC.1
MRCACLSAGMRHAGPRAGARHTVATQGPHAARGSVCRQACDATRAVPNSFPAVVWAQSSLVCRPAEPVD